MSQFADSLKFVDLDIIKFDKKKQRPVSTTEGTMTVEKFSKLMLMKLGGKGVMFPEVFEALHNLKDATNLIIEYADERGIASGPKITPAEYAGLTLNMDVSSGRDTRFFMTTEEEIVAVVSGHSFIKIMQLKEVEAIAMARKVTPEYAPRSEPGVTTKVFEDGMETDVFNTYIPPRWTKIQDKDIPSKLPPLFEKLIIHLFPLAEEREYFYAWLHASLFDRAFVYLVLCGNPGTGKNRLKLVLRALHGHSNAIDGKRSTLVERFNSQLADSTLAWFDELSYDHEMENMMKELQNDSISIERKGIDATRSTNIHASLVVSNNKPRDNYIAFDARKFVPLMINPKRLEVGMTSPEITALTKKVERADSEHFDPLFLAQIAKWVRKNANTKKWPNLEYKGPMFYKLAHTSMTRWQKKAADAVLALDPRSSNRITYDEKLGFLWSSIETIITKKHGEKAIPMPDFTTVKYFFDVFVDGKGNKAFKTKEVEDNILGDFWVKKLFDAKILNEQTDLQANGGKNRGKEKENEEYLDL